MNPVRSRKEEHWSKEENRKLIELYPKIGAKRLSHLMKRSSSSIASRAWFLDLKIKNDNDICAKVIEEFVNDPNLDKKELLERYKIPYHRFAKYVSKWFGYKGDNGVVLVLDSKL